jgi:hypothetical protein
MLHDEPIPIFDVRLSTGEGRDSALIRGLAATAGTATPSGPVFVAELNGEPVAAVGLADGAAIADPARADPAIVKYLRLRRLEAYIIGRIWGG